MDKLICSAENCINNLQGRCTAHSIEVENNDSHSQCKTFAAKGAIETMSRFHNTNLTEGFKDILQRKAIWFRKLIVKFIVVFIIMIEDVMQMP